MKEIEIKTTGLSWAKFLQLQSIYESGKKIKGWLIMELGAVEKCQRENLYALSASKITSVAIGNSILTVTITAIKHD